MSPRVCLALSFMVFGLFSRHLKADEVVTFYPGYARWDETSEQWKAQVHACVYEPEINSLRRTALLAIMRRALRISSADAETELFQQRARLFLVDHERGKDLEIRLGDDTFELGRTGPNGHWYGEVKLDDEHRRAAKMTDPRGANPWSSFQAALPPKDKRQFTGRWQYIAPRGVSVISDLDDTIKISQVADRKQLLANTFLKPFEPVEGMPQLYARWGATGGAFHYVSGSPWQLYLPLEKFRGQAGFPAGSWHLKHFRLTDRSAIDFLRSQTKYKTEVIKKIMADFPDRAFVLVGDTSEQDPEIYAAIAREYPGQALRVLIRESNEKPTEADVERYAKAFENVPREKWQIFTKAEELNDSIPAEWFTRPPEVTRPSAAVKEAVMP